MYKTKLKVEQKWLYHKRKGLISGQRPLFPQKILFLCCKLICNQSSFLCYVVICPHISLLEGEWAPQRSPSTQYHVYLSSVPRRRRPARTFGAARKRPRLLLLASKFDIEVRCIRNGREMTTRRFHSQIFI